MIAEVNIDYEKNFVAFLDVLGFKNIVKSYDLDTLNNYFSILDKVIMQLNQYENKSEIGYIVISDSIILTLAHGANVDENINKLRTLCIAIGIIQHELAQINIWLRGAITSGDTYFDKSKNQIVGPAYIDAYLLEENYAIYPRVIIDSRIIKELCFYSAQELIDCINKKDQGGINYLNWKTNILYDFSLLERGEYINQDTPLFIDYLSLVAYEPNKFRVILDNLSDNLYISNQTYSKFRWVTDYLHSIIKMNNLYPTNAKRHEYFNIKDVTKHASL